MPSGNGIVKSGSIWVGLRSKKFGDRGDRGGMAKINIPSSHMTMTAVFVAITYQPMIKKLISALWKEWKLYFEVKFEIEIERKTY